MRIETAACIRRLTWWAAVLLMASCGGGGSDPGTPVFQAPGSGAPLPSGGTSGGSQTGDGPTPTPDATVQVSTAAVQGQVLSAASGGALAGAPVQFASVTQSADVTGFFAEPSFAATARLVQRASNTGYEELFLPTRVVSGIPAFTLFKLTPEGATTSITATAGGAAQADSGAGRITFAANALQGAAATVPVRVTPVGVGSDTFLISGDYTSSTGAQLEAFGAIVVNNTASATIAPSSPAQLRIPVSTRLSTPPTTARLFLLDPTTATWVENGTATLVNDPAAPYYEGNVTSFGQWMVGEIITSPVMVNGCVADETGARLADVRIVAEGIGYSGLSYVSTNVTGDFSVPVKPNSTLLVSGRRGVLLTNAVSVTSTATNTTLAGCLTLPSINAATVRLTWGEAPADIDSHLRTPGGVHVFYGSTGSLTAEPFSNLDVDDTSGFGPEITTIRQPKVGLYRFYLHNFSNWFSPGMTQSPARVELNYAGRVVVFTPPAGEGTNRYLHLFDLQISANCSMTLYRYNRWRADEPANPNSGTTATACVPN